MKNNKFGDTPSISPSPFSDHLKIAIKCWSRERARQIADVKISRYDAGQMEHFLTELLIDALLTFNEAYNKASEEQINRLERILDEFRNVALPAPIFLRKNHE